MKDFIANNSTIIIFVGLYIAVAAVSVMPKPGDPRPYSEKFYESFYDLLHLLANKAVERNPKLAGATVTVTPATETVITTPTTVSTSAAAQKS
jgi:hypothetical protein